MKNHEFRRAQGKVSKFGQDAKKRSYLINFFLLTITPSIQSFGQSVEEC